jgi:hypothetical protein
MDLKAYSALSSVGFLILKQNNAKRPGYELFCKSIINIVFRMFYYCQFPLTFGDLIKGI